MIAFSFLPQMYGWSGTNIQANRYVVIDMNSTKRNNSINSSWGISYSAN